MTIFWKLLHLQRGQERYLILGNIVYIGDDVVQARQSLQSIVLVAYHFLDVLGVLNKVGS